MVGSIFSGIRPLLKKGSNTHAFAIDFLVMLRTHSNERSRQVTRSTASFLGGSKALVRPGAGKLRHSSLQLQRGAAGEWYTERNVCDLPLFLLALLS